jgi:hypothetical protein
MVSTVATESADGDRFGGIDDASAADSQHQFDLLAPADFNAFINQSQPRIGLDAGEFYPLNARVLKGGGDLVIKAALFNAAAAVVQKHLAGVRPDHFANLSLCASSKYQACAVGKIKVQHGRPSLSWVIE